MADAIATKGYMIYPSELFVNVAKHAQTNPNLNTDLSAIFSAIERSASGTESESRIRGLFADFDTTSNRLGTNVDEKNKRLAAVIKGVESLDFGSFEDHEIDLLAMPTNFLFLIMQPMRASRVASSSRPKTFPSLLRALPCWDRPRLTRFTTPLVARVRCCCK